MRYLPLVWLALICGCPQARPAEPLPEVVKPEVLLATVTGHVLDGNNLPVEGVIVTVSETDRTFTTGPDGAWVVKVPAQTTFTLRTFKNLYAGTTLTPMYLEPDRVVTDLDILVIPSSSIGAYNAQAGPDEERGVLALQVVSLSGRCDAANATVSVLNPQTLAPMPGAVALYVKSGQSQPDKSVPAMQNGAKPNAWLVGVPEGQDFPIRFDKTGCLALPFPVVYGKATWQPGVRIANKGLTQVTVFVE